MTNQQDKTTSVTLPFGDCELKGVLIDEPALINDNPIMISDPCPILWLHTQCTIY